MTTVLAVAAMHEDVHEGASENQEIGQESERVGEVLGPKEDAANDQEGHAYEKGTRCPEAPLRFCSV
jgi:hypothetical protein